MNRPRHIQGLSEAVRRKVALFGQVRRMAVYVQQSGVSGQFSTAGSLDRCSMVWILLVYLYLGESYEHPNGKALGDLCILVAICLDP